MSVSTKIFPVNINIAGMGKRSRSGAHTIGRRISSAMRPRDFVPKLKKDEELMEDQPQEGVDVSVAHRPERSVVNRCDSFGHVCLGGKLCYQTWRSALMDKKNLGLKFANHKLSYDCAI